VKIDWPIDNATEEMGQYLRYIGKDLYEMGEKYAESLNHKLFENYGFHHAVGGRRTAAVVAAQFLKKMEFISTVYVASSESRTLTRLSERGVTRFVLVKLPVEEISRLVAESRMQFDNFVERFLIDLQDDYGVGVFQVVYSNTIHSKPPEDGKLRELKTDFQWLTVSDQLLVPLRGISDIYPIPYSTIYTPEIGDMDQAL
jgi:hypothetical protein